MMSTQKYNAKMTVYKVFIGVCIALILVSIVVIIRSQVSIQASNATIATVTAYAVQLQAGVVPNAFHAAQATLAALQVEEVTAIARYENANATYEARQTPAQVQLQSTPLPDALLQTERGSFYATQEQADAEWTYSVNATFEASWTLTPTPGPCRTEDFSKPSWDDEERMFLVGIIPSLNGAESVEAIRAIPEVETLAFDPAGSFRNYERWVGTLRDDVTPVDVEARIVVALEIMCHEWVAQGARECESTVFLSNFDPDTGDFSIYHLANRLSIARAAADAVRAIPEVETLWNLYGEEGWLIENQWLGRLRDNYSASPEEVEQRIVEALDILCEEYR